MRADISTSVTLDTVLRIPYRDIYSDTTFLVCSSTGWCSTVNIIFKCRYRQCITFLSINLSLDVVNEINNFLTSFCSVSHMKTLVCSIFPALWNLNLNNLLSTSIDSCPVLLNNIITFTSVCCFRSSFHKLDSLLLRNDSGKFEECGLKDCIDTCWSHASLDTDLNTVDGVEFDTVVSDECLNLSWKMFLKTFHIPCTVQKECTAVNQFLYHVIFVHIGRIVACYKVCFVDQVGRFDRFLTKTKVGHCNTTGLLGVIIKVCLSVHICIVTDDLDGVLVSTYSTISTKSPELTVCCSLWSSYKRSACLKGKVCNIINDTKSKFLFLSIVINSYDLSRCCVLGTKSVTSGEDLNAVKFAVLKCSNNIKIQRLALSSWLFCSVQNCDLFNCLRNSIDKSLCAEWSVKTNFNNTNFSASCH